MEHLTNPPNPTAASKKMTVDEKKEILKVYGLTCLSVTTTYQWMRALGFKYEPQKILFCGWLQKKVQNIIITLLNIIITNI